MSSFEVLHDVSEMLVNLLREKLDEVGLISVAVTAISPLAEVDGPDAQAEARLNLFLYLVRPDEHRSYPGGVQVPTPGRRPGSGVVVAAPPLALKLYYLITAFGPDQLVQQRLLGLAMRVFHDNSILAPPDNDLDPVPPLRPSRMQLVLQNLGIADINAVWNTTSAVRETSAAYELSGIFLESGQERATIPLVAGADRIHRRTAPLLRLQSMHPDVLVSGQTVRLRGEGFGEHVADPSYPEPLVVFREQAGRRTRDVVLRPSRGDSNTLYVTVPDQPAGSADEKTGAVDWTTPGAHAAPGLLTQPSGVIWVQASGQRSEPLFYELALRDDS